MLTPERSMEIQRLLGSDIVMAFDECTPHPATREQAEASMRLSMRWAARSREAFGDRPGTRCSASSRGRSSRTCGRRAPRRCAAIGFDGYAIGGLAVGEGQARCSRCWTTRRGSFPKTGRAT
jgi:queuine tRNA-ribosyltransferase